ncbi:hypothetical protein LA080_015549 [Diaporthe eres]|nr:hypothetical protein LA080_015549 [Diaporthe eres]
MTMLCRAPHIVQRFFMGEHPVGGLAIPGNRRSRRVADMASRVDGAQGEYILMDYCKFGNLDSQLMKAAIDMPPDNRERWLPEPVLWRIFDCLVKGCMAMQCPPRHVPGNAPPAPPPPIAPASAFTVALSAIIVAIAAVAGVPNAFPVSNAVLANAANPPVTLPTSGGNLPEVIAPGYGTIAGHRGMVHFDLVETSTPPQLVLSQVIQQFHEYNILTRKDKWNQRHAGKLGYSLPEQFGKDWDMVPNFQDPSDPGAWMPAWMAPWNPPPPITSGPARYSSASNVWHIGMIMKVCMTLRNPDSPPYAGRMRSEEPPTPLGRTPPANQQRWTYGWSLLDPTEPWLNKYQRPLIDLVARCLMAKQEFRPTLQQIQAIVMQELANAANAAVPAYWTNTFFAQPRPPQPPRNTEFVEEIDPFWDYRAHMRI